MAKNRNETGSGAGLRRAGHPLDAASPQDNQDPAVVRRPKATPANAAPAKAAPAKAAPAKAAPAKAAKLKVAPAKAAKLKVAPVKAAPAQAARRNSVAAQGPAPRARPPTSRAATASPSGSSRATTARDPSRADTAQGWSESELAAVRTALVADQASLQREIESAEQALLAVQGDGSGQGAGDDQADAGTKTFEREQEMSLAQNSRDLLVQVERALARVDNQTYGACESCGQSIGKARLQAFPRATLCVACKQREERH